MLSDPVSEKWSRIHVRNQINTKIYLLLEGHPLPIPIKFMLPV